MKTKILLSVPALLLMLSAFSQKPTVELAFTAIDSAAYVQLDSIKVMNRTQGGETVIIYPDTTMTLQITAGDTLLYIGYCTFIPVGQQEIDREITSFRLFQNYPNPVQDQSIIVMHIPEKGTLSVLVTDIQGRVMISRDLQPDKGVHSFRFTPGDGSLYILTARWNGSSKSIKILITEPNTGKGCMLDHIGSEIGTGTGKPHLKSSSPTTSIVQQSGILDSPSADETYTFRFATNIPCPGMPTVTYEGQVYHTIQVFSHCWMKENLNVGTMINGTQDQADNGIVEKYCHNNQPDSCTKYGGLYQWDEMMQFATQQGAQGICPPGWHLPTDEEWKVLEGAVDSHNGMGDEIWDLNMFRGFDAGKNLKTASGWKYNGNGTDLFGFSVRPASYRLISGGFDATGAEAVYWMSTEINSSKAWYRNLFSYYLGVGRWDDSYSVKNYGFSVRCIRDY